MVSRSSRKGRSATVWLDADQQRAWRHLLSLTMLLPAAIDSDLQRSAGLTMFEYTVLANLSEADRVTLRMSDLAYRANSSLSRLSHVVSRLERDGLVKKRSCSTDRRVSEVVLSSAGAAKVRQAAPDHVGWVRKFVIEPLTPTQLSRLGDAASMIAGRLAELDANPK